MPISFEPPCGAQLLPPERMTPRARVHACWLSLRAGFSLDPEGWAFDPATNTTIVVNGRGDTVWGQLWPLDAQQGEQLIEDRYGPDGRERARRALG